MTRYGKTLIDVNEYTYTRKVFGTNEVKQQTVQVGNECKVGHFGGHKGTFFCEPAKVVRIQKDEFGGHRVCVQGQKSGYKVYCTESGMVSTKRFGNFLQVVFDKMQETDVLDLLYNFN